VAESQRDYNIKVAQYNATVNQQRAEADLAYDLQKYKTEQLSGGRGQGPDRPEGAETRGSGARNRPPRARASRQRAETGRGGATSASQTIAEAEQYRLKAEASGKADADALLGQAKPRPSGSRGLAQVEIEKARVCAVWPMSRGPMASRKRWR
jgi:flotillin